MIWFEEYLTHKILSRIVHYGRSCFDGFAARYWASHTPDSLLQAAPLFIYSYIQFVYTFIHLFIYYVQCCVTDSELRLKNIDKLTHNKTQQMGSNECKIVYCYFLV